jgi:hypothetical protein
MRLYETISFEEWKLELEIDLDLELELELKPAIKLRIFSFCVRRFISNWYVCLPGPRLNHDRIAYRL